MGHFFETHCTHKTGFTKYIGETKLSPKERFSEHKGYVNIKNMTNATGINS